LTLDIYSRPIPHPLSQPLLNRQSTCYIGPIEYFKADEL